VTAEKPDEEKFESIADGRSVPDCACYVLWAWDTGIGSECTVKADPVEANRAFAANDDAYRALFEFMNEIDSQRLRRDFLNGRNPEDMAQEVLRMQRANLDRLIEEGKVIHYAGRYKSEGAWLLRERENPTVTCADQTPRKGRAPV
jgi:hypothetical protein